MDLIHQILKYNFTLAPTKNIFKILIYIAIYVNGKKIWKKTKIEKNNIKIIKIIKKKVLIRPYFFLKSLIKKK